MRAATNENVDTIFIVVISKNLAVFLSVIVHLTMILNTTRTATIVFVTNENDSSHYDSEQHVMHHKILQIKKIKKFIKWFSEKQNPQLPLY